MAEKEKQVSPQEEIQKEYARLSLLRERASQLAARQRVLIARMSELENSIKALNELKEKAGETLIAIGSDVYVKCNVNREKVIINVGAGVCVEKHMSEAIKLLEEKKEKLRKALEEINREIERLAPLIAESEERLAKLASSISGK